MRRRLEKLDPFVLLDKFAAEGKLKPAVVRKVKGREGVLKGAIARVERASGLRYPGYYVDPALSLATTALEYGSIGALYARVIPTVYESSVAIVVQFTAPLLAYGTKGTIEAVAAHEFTHYVDLVRRLSRMDVTSDVRASTLFEAEFADEERVVDPSLVLPRDKKLASLVKRKFKEGLVDRALNEKVAKNWIEKGLPARRVSPEENVVNLSVDAIARARFDPLLLERIRQLDGSVRK
jgi:hypothetical protein